MQPFFAKKSLGQNFLKNPAIAGKMVAVGEVTERDTVLEIGPGTGMLTRELLKTGAKVIALEADDRAISVLEGDFAPEIASQQLVLVHGDARKFDFTALNLAVSDFKVIANIPYYLTGMLFRTLLSGKMIPKTLVFLVQKEIAERIAKTEKESLLSLSIKAYGKPQYVETVKRGNFSPAPKVDSAILAISDISYNRFDIVDPEWFFTVLRAGFGSRRKQLVGNLKKVATKESIEETFKGLGLSEKIRGEDISIDTWMLLVRKLIPLST